MTINQFARHYRPRTSAPAPARRYLLDRALRRRCGRLFAAAYAGLALALAVAWALS